MIALSYTEAEYLKDFSERYGLLRRQFGTRKSFIVAAGNAAGGNVGIRVRRVSKFRRKR